MVDPARVRVVFMGTPDFAVPFLNALIEAGFSLAGVLSQPDRPRGRGQELSPSPVKALAESRNIPVFSPSTLRDGEALSRLREWKPDVVVVVAYGKILPGEILALPPHGCVNVHASLLPSFRGASPIVWAVRSGVRESGVSLMLMDKGMDTGPVLRTLAFPLEERETSVSLAGKMMAAGPGFMVDGLLSYLDGTLLPVPQSGDFSMAPMIRKEDGRISFARMPAIEIDRHVRAMNPWPGSYLDSEAGTLRIHRGEVLSGSDGERSPGEVAAVSALGIDVCCEKGLYRILEIQKPGGRKLKVSEFLAGSSMSPGFFLG
ncbi:MAG: methionyl-tRNA formyltransferase [Nitrospiraceae bacterium]|nr:methionyl-tRNA formyltransferase [Nitrospiraceae bacterium]